MKKTVLVLMILALVAGSGCLQQEQGQGNGLSGVSVDKTEFLEGVECDAMNKCSEGYECASFPVVGPSCYPREREVCGFVACPPGTECVVAESYPVQIFCS